jgi:hypothetical protein
MQGRLLMQQMSRYLRNPIIYSLLKAIDNHMALYLRHRDFWHLRKAAMLREYVHEIKAYILRLEEL